MECVYYIGASADPSKYGNKIMKCYLAHNKAVFPINKKEMVIEGVNCVPSVSSLPKEILPDLGLSIVTPPPVTRAILEEAFNAGVRNYLLQPGTSDAICKDYIDNVMRKDTKCNVINSCVLVELGC